MLPSMSTISSISAQAAAGLHRATDRLGAAASSIAEAGPGIAAAVETMQAKTDFKANAAVLRTANEMMGALLDITA